MKFVDFIQEELHKRYDLRFWKRYQTQDQSEEPSQPTNPKKIDKGKHLVRFDPMPKGEPPILHLLRLNLKTEDNKLCNLIQCIKKVKR